MLLALLGRTYAANRTCCLWNASCIIFMPDGFVKHKYRGNQIFAVAILTPGPMVDAATQDLI